MADEKVKSCRFRPALFSFQACKFSVVHHTHNGNGFSDIAVIKL
jgi:hypothetical protein